MDALQRHGQAVFGEAIPTSGTPLYTDVRLYGAHGVPAVIYGAGPRTVLESNAKRADEHLVLSDLQGATRGGGAHLVRPVAHLKAAQGPQAPVHGASHEAKACTELAKSCDNRSPELFMTLTFLKRRTVLAAAALLATPLLALAQTTPIKFQLDWRFEGPAALFLASQAKGYYKDAKLDVTIDAGNGSGGTVTRVASRHLRHGLRRPGGADGVPRQQPRRAEQAGGGDDGLQQHAGRRAGAEEERHHQAGRPERQEAGRARCSTPAAAASRSSPRPTASANVTWTSMDPPLRETMLVRGDIDAITGFSFTSLLNLEARGVKAEDVVVLPYPAYGVKLYGNVVIASPKLLKENPEAVKAFLKAFAKGAKEVMATPDPPSTT